MMPGRHVAAARVLVRPFHRLELLVDVELAARFEHQHLHPLRGEDVRGHAAGGARANDDGVVDAGQVGLGLWRALDQSEKVHVLPEGFAPRTPLHALSLAAPTARSNRVAHSRGSFACVIRDDITRQLRYRAASESRLASRRYAPGTPYGNWR